MDLFRLGARVGLKPDELLDLSWDTLQAYIDGYSDRLFDMQLVGLQTGYWAGYYGNPRHKKPKPLAYIEDLLRKGRVPSRTRRRKHAPEVDVEAFLETERKFLSRMQTLEEKKHGK